MASPFLARVRRASRLEQYSYRTERSYVSWVRRFILFHDERHPRQLGARHIAAFLTHLAADRHVGPSNENQALAALLFLYRDVLGVDPSELRNVLPARRSRRLPTVLTRAEVRLLPPHTPCATASPPTSSRTATTSAPSRSYSATATSRAP